MNACSIWGVVATSYSANNQKIADKKKADYQEALENSRADSTARTTWKTRRKVVHEAAKVSYMKDPEKSRADMTLEHEAAKVT